MATSSLFLALPAELRNEILLLTVTQEPPIVFHFITSTALDGHEEGHSSHRMVCAQVVAIARTCRQLKREALPIYYGANDFLIDMTGSPNDESRGEWWNELLKYKPDLETLGRITLGFDLDFDGECLISYPGLHSSFFCDITTTTASPTGQVKAIVRTGLQQPLCLCVVQQLVSIVNQADNPEWFVCGSSVITLCALLEENFIRKVVVSSDRYQNAHCFRCRYPSPMDKARLQRFEDLRTRAEARDRAEAKREMNSLRRKYGSKMSESRIRKLEGLPAGEERGRCVEVKPDQAGAKDGILGLRRLMQWAKRKCFGTVGGKRD